VKDSPVTWIWRQVGVDLPADWECLQFSREWDAGRCAFADRHGYRFELNWRRFKSEPDLERMLKDYAGSLAATWQGIRRVSSAGIEGLTGRRGEEAVSRYGAFLNDIGLLVELVFVHAEKREESLEHSILRTLRAVPPETGFQRWRAFGMDLRVPEDFRLEECVVEPARVGLRFNGRRKPDRWIFRRYGMVPSWLKTPVRHWLEEQTDESVKERRTSAYTRGNIGISRLNGRWRPKGLLLPRGVYASAAWVEERDQRLYQAICITGKHRAALHPANGADEVLRAAPEFLVIPAR